MQSDVIVLGGGLVGLTLAVALDAHGLTSVVVDPVDPATALAPGHDGRASAIASASWAMLEAIGVTPALAGEGCPIRAIRVADGLAPGGLTFSPGDERPLGTMVGLYETAVDRLMSWEIDGKPVRPKVIASTATVRRATDQVHRLFLRRVEVFPPPGLDVEDNFFARERVPSGEYPGRLYVGVASGEEAAGAAPGYECCRFRGSLVALDAATGAIVWKTYTVDAPQPTTKNAVGTQLWGPSGAPIWSSPAIDPKRNVVYATTGNNYSNPFTPLSDAFIAFDLDTGRILWSQQMTEGDAWIAAPFGAVHRWRGIVRARGGNREQDQKRKKGGNAAHDGSPKRPGPA